MDIINIKNLSFFYHRQNPLFEEINLTITKGDFVGIVGPNGSGKSTLIKLLLGLLIPQNGEIYIMDHKIKPLKDCSAMGYVSQRATSFNTGFPATVKEVVSAPLKARTSFFSLQRNFSRQVEEVLQLVGLTDSAHKLIGNLSGGQQQRALIARTLIANPSILVLDEPFVGIDQVSQETIITLLKNLNKVKGTTLIIITHDLRWIEQEVDLMICVESGKIHCHRQEKVVTDHQHLIYHTHLGV